MESNLFGSVNLLQKGMNVSWLRGEVINNNIANEDTVGYKASKVEFEDVFAKSLAGDTADTLDTTNARHIPGGFSDVENVKASVVKESEDSIRYDGNNVDAEHEQAEMAKNTLEYYTLVSKMNSEFRKLDSAIKVT